MRTRGQTLHPRAQVVRIKRGVKTSFERAFWRRGHAIKTQQGPIVGRRRLRGDGGQQREQQDECDCKTGQTKLHESLPKGLCQQLLRAGGLRAKSNAKSSELEPLGDVVTASANSVLICL